jgi:predicted RNA methylase
VQVSFLREVGRELSGRWPAAVIDLGCGPARHAVEFALQGTPRVLALDSNEHMLEYGQRLAREAGVDVEFMRSSLKSYDLEVWIALGGSET